MKETKELSVTEMMSRLLRVCPEARIICELNNWILKLPKAYLLRIDNENIVSEGNPSCWGATPDLTVKNTWSKIVKRKEIVLAIGGESPWSAVKIVQWDPESDDWKDYTVSKTPTYAVVKYKSD